MEIHGYCDARFGALREEFERNFTERGDVGASCAATVDGEYVIDIWGGPSRRRQNVAVGG